MASIYRRSYWTTINGERVKRQTRVYYIKYKDGDGKVQRVKGYVNKAKTQTKAAKLEAEAANGPNPFEKHRRTALSVHLDAYKQHLNAKNDDPEHVRQTCSAISRVLDGCEFKVFDDVQVSAVENWIAKQRERSNFGIRTANYHTKAVKAFLTWMVKNGRAPSNPLTHMADLNGKVDVRRQRRSLPQEDFCRLVEAAGKGKTFRRLSGPDRAMLYEAAAYTGLREGELASLTRASFDLDANPPTVTVEADKSKHRAKDVLPIHPELAARLREWMPVEGLLWPGSWHERGSEMVQADLKAAKKAWIEEVKPEERPERERSSRFAYRDDQGRYFDFHALRGQFVSSLARAGVHPKVAQQLARHSTIHLTMANYTHLDTADLAGALNTLPPLLRDENHWPKNWPTEVGNEGQNGSLPVKTAGGEEKGQETPNPLQDKGFSNVCHQLSERRARDSKSGLPHVLVCIAVTAISAYRAKTSLLASDVTEGHGLSGNVTLIGPLGQSASARRLPHRRCSNEPFRQRTETTQRAHAGCGHHRPHQRLCQPEGDEPG